MTEKETQRGRPRFGSEKQKAESREVRQILMHSAA